MIKTEQMAASKSNRALTMTVHILALDFHIGAMPQNTVNHCRRPR